MPVRRNILKDTTARDKFIEGVLRLNREMTTTRTGTIRPNNQAVIGPDISLSTWDLFSLWHYTTMNTSMTPGTRRNAAHGGPVFLPWHRWFLLNVEANFQRVLQDNNFALPYWDWTVDGGNRPLAQQTTLPIWNVLGHAGLPVADGPFAFHTQDPQTFRVRIRENAQTGRLEAVNRGLWRQFGPGRSLPKSSGMTNAIVAQRYDKPVYDESSDDGVRNRLEGWLPFGLHNLVHDWISGDMAVGTSPNDPVFYLNHCNVDRIWEGWMTKRGRVYEPLQTAPQSLFRHRPDDPLFSMITSQQPKVSEMLDLSQFVTAARLPTYDVLPTVP